MIKLLLVDFDGVMSMDRFYANPPKEHQKAISELQQHLFGDDKTLVTQWMRGELSFQQLHREVAAQSGIDPSIYDEALTRSVHNMRLNVEMLETIASLRKAGVAVALFTDNMDIFDNLTVPLYELDQKFDAIYSSSAYGRLKLENDTLLMRAAREADAQPHQVALVDDRERSCEFIRSLGGHAFLYDNYTDSHPAFTSWLGRLL